MATFEQEVGNPEARELFAYGDEHGLDRRTLHAALYGAKLARRFPTASPVAVAQAAVGEIEGFVRNAPTPDLGEER